MRHWLLRIISLILTAGVTCLAEGATAVLDLRTREQSLEQEISALRVLQGYYREIDEAVVRGEILLVDDKMGMRVPVTRLRLKDLLGALRDLDRSGVAATKMGFFQIPLSGEVDKVIEAYDSASRRAYEQTLKPASVAIAQRIADSGKELAAIRAQLARSPNAPGDLWIMQPTRWNPDNNPLKVVDSGKKAHIYERAAVVKPGHFSFTDRHLFQGKQGTHDYTCTFDFSDPAKEIKPGMEIKIDVSGSCRANAGFKMGTMVLKLVIKGRAFKLKPAPGETEARSYLAVGERPQFKIPSDKRTFILEATDSPTERGAIMQVQLEADGWGRIALWSWKYGEQAIR